jgi:hypothetical protein
MTVPAPLVRKVRRDYYVKAKANRNGGKGVPPKHSVIYGIYKRLERLYKRRPTSDLKYQKKAIKFFARSRSFTKLDRLASFERRFGDMALGFSLKAAISKGVYGAMRELSFDNEQMPTSEPLTWATSN